MTCLKSAANVLELRKKDNTNITCTADARARVCVCVCVYVCVFTSIHLEGFIFLGLEVQGTDQRFCVEDVISLCQFPSSTLQYESPSLSN